MPNYHSFREWPKATLGSVAKKTFKKPKKPKKRGPTVWEYASIEIAEASGDPWAEADEILITGGATFKYRSDLVVNNYSGLVHKEPFGSGNGEMGTATPIVSADEGDDPDTWSGWTDISTGLKGSDYDFVIEGGLGTLSKITTAGRAGLENDHDVGVGDEETFACFEKLRCTNSSGSGTGNKHAVGLRSYFGVGDYRFISLVGKLNTTSLNWFINHTDGTTFAESTMDRTTAGGLRVWLYTKADKWALWNSDDATPNLSGDTPRTHATLTQLNRLFAGESGATGIAKNFHGRFVSGNMTTI